MTFEVMNVDEIGDNCISSFRVCKLAGFPDRDINNHAAILYDSAVKNVTHLISEGALETGIVHPGNHAFRSEDRPWQVATPDRLVTNPLADMEMPTGMSPAAALSLMVTSGRVKGPISFYRSAPAAKTHPLEVPVTYANPLIRVHHEMDVLGVSRAYIAAFDPDTGDVRIGEFERYGPLTLALREVGLRGTGQIHTREVITKDKIRGLVREAINETYKGELN